MSIKKGVVGFIIFGVIITFAAAQQLKKEDSVMVSSTSTGEAVASVSVSQGAGCEGASCGQASAPQMSLVSQVVVYYFHGNARCPSCYKLEQYAKEALEQNFGNEMKAGIVIFKRINVDQPGNDHFVQDYQLYTKSVVVSLVKEGKQVRYKNLERVWDLLRDQKKYHDYIKDEIKPFVGGL